MDHHLLIGKTRGSLDKPDELPTRDAFVANDDHPELELHDKTVQRAVWANVSVRTGNFSKCDFSYTTFINCYFRDASFRDCDFTGCRFVHCNFQSRSMLGCNFRYSRWEKTEVRRVLLLGNLPAQSNLAQKLLIQLRLNSASIGEYDDARYYLYEAEKKSREHYLEIMKCRNEYYRKKYAFSQERLMAPFRYARSWLNNVVWGYGEQPIRLSVSGLVLILVFGVIYAHADDSLGLWEGVRLSFGAFVNGLPGVNPADTGTSIWLLIESLVGIVYIAFLAASLHRRVSTRRD